MRIPLGLSEWALVVPPSGPRARRASAADLPGPLFVRPPPGQFALVRLPGPVDPNLGLAVLHYRRGRTRIYCSRDHITARAAWVLSALAGHAFDEASGPESNLTVTPLGHSLLPAELHPAASLMSGHRLTCYVCADLITADLAEVLGVLWTAHVAYLFQPGRRQAEHGEARLPPAQLPVDVADFTGREDQVGFLAGLLPGGGGESGAVRIALVHGQGGLGKTALAVHAAHWVRGRFPGGQLYADLLGGTPGPLPPADVLARFLRDLGVDGRQVPVGEEERAALYRTRLAGRQMLIVLDNARDAAQVRPLLPGTASCAVLVTTRSRMPDLAGATLVDLGVLGDGDALALFTRIVGAERVTAEPEATAEVLLACAGLPLAIRICAARLASRAAWTIRTMADRLRREHRLLDELQAGDLAVRASFQVSFAALPAAGQPGEVAPADAFRLLGLWQGASISAAAAGALFGASEYAAADALEVLVDAHLLESGGPDRYQFHDLLRVYAAERAAADLPDRDAAIGRLLAWYMHAADAAATTVVPHRYNIPLDPAPDPAPAFISSDDALAWYDSERANLVTATRQAAASGLHQIAWRLPAPLFSMSNRLGNWAECIAAHRIALDSARQVGDRQGEAWVLNNLGEALGIVGASEGVGYLQQSLALRREIGDRHGEAQSANNLADTYSRLGRTGEAIKLCEMARDVSREIGYKLTEGVALVNLGDILLRLDRGEDAIDCLRQAELVFAEIRYEDGSGYALHLLGRANASLGRYAEARACLQQALACHQAAGNRHRYAVTLGSLAKVYLAAGQKDEGRGSLLRALAIFTELGDDAQAAKVRSDLQSLEAEAGAGLLERRGPPHPAVS